MGPRRRPRGKIDREDEEDELAKSVVFLSSSDDEEANKDLTLDIIERSKRRRKASKEELIRAVDLSADSSDEIEAAVGGGGEAVTPRAAEEKKKRKRGKKKPRTKKKKEEEVEDEEAGAPCDDTLDTFAMEDEPIGTNDSVITNVNDVPDNVVLRKLLRGPRYFDPGDRSWGACYNCGEEGHTAIDCTTEKRQKPCFICGILGHNAKNCTQGQDCFICKRRGHLAKDCPDKHQRSFQESKICLCCGNAGHEMSSCRNDYAPNDLKETQCYVCQKFGHLCCLDFVEDGPREVSCYNCAQSGHTGLGCAKPRGEISVETTPTLCYKCGEEGHFARGCTKNAKVHVSELFIYGFHFIDFLRFDPVRISQLQRWMDDLALAERYDVNGVPKRWKISKENRDSLGSRSVPTYFKKTDKRKSLQNEGRRSVPSQKSRIKGGWIVDDPGDLPEAKTKANCWSSPTMLTRKSSKYCTTSGRPHTRSPVKKYKSLLRTPASNVCMGSYKPVFSASQFGSSRSCRGKS